MTGQNSFYFSLVNGLILHF